MVEKWRNQWRLQDIDFSFSLSFSSRLSFSTTLKLTVLDKSFNSSVSSPRRVLCPFVNFAIVICCFLSCSHSISVPLLWGHIRLMVIGTRGYFLTYRMHHQPWFDAHSRQHPLYLIDKKSSCEEGWGARPNTFSRATLRRGYPSINDLKLFNFSASLLRCLLGPFFNPAWVSLAWYLWFNISSTNCPLSYQPVYFSLASLISFSPIIKDTVRGTFYYPTSLSLTFKTQKKTFHYVSSSLHLLSFDLNLGHPFS